MIWLGAKLIRARVADRADQPLQVELAVNKILRQGIEQRGVRRRIRHSHIVFWLDKPATKEMLPVAIHERAGEERVLRVGHPVDERLPWVLVVSQFERRGAKARRLHRLTAARI